MTDPINVLLADQQKLTAEVKRVAKAYSTAIAISMIGATDKPFARVAENVEIDHGECRRRLTIDWHLPSLAEALPDYEHATEARFIQKFNELNPVLVVPIFVVRRGRLMNNFCIEDSNGDKLYICGTEEWLDRTRLVLGFFWNLVDLVPVDTCVKDRLSRIRRKYFSLPNMDVDRAPKAVTSVVKKLKNTSVPLYPGLLGRLEVVGSYIAKRHMIWLHLTRRPGQTVRLTLSYRTRFAAEYLPHPKNGQSADRNYFLRAVERVRRAVGQEPFEFRIPLSMHCLCTSYHFTMSAPPGNYFVEQRFSQERTLGLPKKRQIDEFNKMRKANPSLTTHGKNEAGGPVAHLYARNLPGTVGDQIYAYALIRERPPGTTALVMWLTLFSTIFIWFYWMIWGRLVADDTQGIDVAALFVALPGLASIWFSRAFKDDIRPRIPLVSRLGLLAVGMSAFYALLGVVVQRGVCNAKATTCPTLLTSAFSHGVLLCIAVLLTVITLWLIGRRISFQRSYRRLQENIIDRYMR